MKDSMDKTMNNHGNRRGLHPNSLKNLEKRHKFLPGNNANPKGRPKKELSLTNILEAILFDEEVETGKERVLKARHLVQRKVESSFGRDTTAAKDREDIWNRLEGKAAEKLEVEGEIALWILDFKRDTNKTKDNA